MEWLNLNDGSGAAITDFGGARISDELALKKRRIHKRLSNQKESMANNTKAYGKPNAFFNHSIFFLSS